MTAPARPTTTPRRPAASVRAQGIVAAVKDIGLTMPLVVRLEGTNVEKGKEILAASGLNIVSASDLDDAAIKAVAAIN